MSSPSLFENERSDAIFRLATLLMLRGRYVGAEEIEEDVEQEPIAADNPLLKMDNVIATPHAAYFSSPAVASCPGASADRLLHE